MDHSFIKTYPNALSDEACDAIMDQFWKDDWLHMPGRTTAGVDPNKKESLEMIENVTSFSGTMSGDKKFINENI